MFKFMRSERVDKELSLVEVFLELWPIQSLLDTGDFLLVSNVGSGQVSFLFSRRNMIKTIRPVVDWRFVDAVSHESIALIVHDRTERSVDGKIIEIERSAKLLSAMEPGR